MTLRHRAARFAALGDVNRLVMAEALYLHDRTPRQLGELTGMGSNLLSHHLAVLEQAGIVTREVSGGDSRRRYARLDPDVLDIIRPPEEIAGRSVVFLCRGNSARSQLAEAAARAHGGLEVQSAGISPADQIHPRAIAAASKAGLSFEGQRPKTYAEVEGQPDLVITVCDIAAETNLPFAGRRLHWSIPDPVNADDPRAFEMALEKIEQRLDSLYPLINGGKT